MSAAQAERFDEDRLRLIFKFFEPLKCYVGEEMWDGYVLFEFKNSTSLLEHQFYGNAAYVLSGEWTEMVHRTKAEIRSEFSTRCIKVNHAGDWMDRIRKALREASYMQLKGQAADRMQMNH
jgi:hypothetical protein